MTFGITVNTYVRMCGNIVLRHTCDEYSVLISKSGMTLIDHRNIWSLTSIQPIQLHMLGGSLSSN
jgi:hypothetical protein